MTFALVNLTWVFFRANNFHSAARLVGVMLGVPADARRLVSLSATAGILGVTGIMLVGRWLLRDSSLEEAASRLPWWLRAALLALMLVMLVLSAGKGTDALPAGSR